MTEQTRFETNMQRLDAVRIGQKAALEALGRTPSDVWSTYPEELRAVSGSSGGAVQESKTVVPDPAGMEILPDDPYAAMLQVILQGDPNFQPWNIAAGIDVWGKTGSARPKVSDTFPDDLPAAEEEFDEAVQDLVSDSEDKFVLIDNDGNITVGYLYAEGNEGMCWYGDELLPTIPKTSAKTVIVKSGTSYFCYAAYFALYYGKRTFPISGYAISSIDRVSTLSNGAWSSFEAYDKDLDGAVYMSGKTIVWSSVDIYHTNDSLYHAGSVAVPYKNFEITSYDPATTEFKAKGWLRVSYHTTGEHAGTITVDNFGTDESGGWNYFRNMRYCSRPALYHADGYEVWPEYTGGST